MQKLECVKVSVQNLYLTTFKFKYECDQIFKTLCFKLNSNHLFLHDIIEVVGVYIYTHTFFQEIRKKYCNKSSLIQEFVIHVWRVFCYIFQSVPRDIIATIVQRHVLHLLMERIVSLFANALMMNATLLLDVLRTSERLQKIDIYVCFTYLSNNFINNV